MSFYMLEELITQGKVRIFVHCDNCHLRNSCANAVIGCSNYKLYEEIQDDEEEEEDEDYEE